MLKNRQLLLAKVETSYGVDASPVPASNSILAEIADVQIVSRSLERNNVKSYFGKLATVNVGDALKLDFTTELKGSGTAGTPPEIGALFRGCNFTETIVASTKVDYDPNSNVLDSESLTLYLYIDGILHKLLGCRGTFSMDAKAGEYAKIKWSFTGIYAKPTDSALLSGTYNGQIPPRFLNASFAIDSYAAIIENLKTDIGNDVVKRSDANHATGIREYFIKERNVVGEIDPESVLLATKDFYAMWENSSRVALTATIGQTAGNKCIITAPKVELAEIPYADRDNLLTHNMKLVFTPNSGNDEIKYSFQ